MTKTIKTVTVGIDLGTTYSAIAWFDTTKNESVVLHNLDGNAYTPSVVCIKNGEIFIGEEAKAMQRAGESNVAAFYKSAMGATGYSLFTDGAEYTPEQLSAIFLRELVKNVCLANDVEIKDAIITVPAYFDEAQRAATAVAGEAAGLNVLLTMNEPTAALIAYGLKGERDNTSKTVMVYDLGGGTFDVSIARICNQEISVLCTNGNHKLGGKDWDAAIYGMLAESFFVEFDIDINACAAAQAELTVKAEQVKMALSKTDSAMTTVQCNGKSGNYTVTRADFEDATAGLLYQTLQLVNRCFAELSTGDAPFSWESLDEVVLVGGSTRMPQVRALTEREFGKPPYTKNINLDTIVAQGAAMEASLIHDGALTLNKSNAAGVIDTVTLMLSDIQDITAHALGMLAHPEGGKGYVNSIIIPKNSPFDKDFTRTFTYSGSELEVYVLQGEAREPMYCTPLYKYRITGMSKPEGEINVTFRYDRSGLVQVFAVSDGINSCDTYRENFSGTITDVIDKLERQASVRPIIDVLILADTSFSMRGKPLFAAKKALRKLTDRAGSHFRISVINFAEYSERLCEFETDNRRLGGVVGALNIDTAGCGTSASPLSEWGESFPIDGDKRVIVILTDGEWTTRQAEESYAEKLKNDGVIIYAVGFGDADNAFLNTIASPGRAVKTELSELVDVFLRIASTIASETGGV